MRVDLAGISRTRRNLLLMARRIETYDSSFARSRYVVITAPANVTAPMKRVRAALNNSSLKSQRDNSSIGRRADVRWKNRGEFEKRYRLTGQERKKERASV